MRQLLQQHLGFCRQGTGTVYVTGFKRFAGLLQIVADMCRGALFLVAQLACDAVQEALDLVQ